VVKAKEELRRAARRTRDAISPAVAVAAAEAAARHLLALAPVAAARTVALYAAVRGELDPTPAGRRLAARGVRLVYPRVLGSERRLTFHDVALGPGGPADLHPGAFGILEPQLTAPLVALDAIDLFVVPGLAFDPSGARLGWGLGFYDCTLAQAPAAPRIGYCYACQLLPHVPLGRDDIPMHQVVTEAGASHARDGGDRG
jgi:5-formyltetrahydrofolate cyclo-ligase